jgi:hypothetical protein
MIGLYVLWEEAELRTARIQHHAGFRSDQQNLESMHNIRPYAVSGARTGFEIQLHGKHGRRVDPLTNGSYSGCLAALLDISQDQSLERKPG